MRIFATALMGCLAATQVHAQAARQFDLQCAGSRLEVVDGAPEPYEYGFRIDLDANRWCWAHCERTFEIQEVAPDKITFFEDSEDTYRKRQNRWNSVSRTTGEHELLTIETRPLVRYYKVQGRCTAQPFSGFPTALF